MPTSLVECTLFPCAMEIPEDEKQQLPSPTGGDLPEGLVFVSSGSEGPDEAEDHEEGEIQDEDDEDEPQKQDLEDISSEEESTIRERMAALEAMDKRVGMMKRKFANHSKYDYLDVGEVMNGKENYCYYYPQHQHLSYRNHKPYKSTIANKEDNRYSVGNKHTRTATTKRTADKAKEKSTKRSSHRRHKRRRYASRSPTPSERRALSSDSEPEAVVDREYLKIALGIGNRKNQRLTSSRNPLKKKLLMQTSKRKRSVDGRQKTVTEVLECPSSNSDNDAIVVDEDDEEEEEEEELQLRLLALSTKPVVREAGLIISEFQIPSPPPPPTINAAEDNMSDAVSAEEQELRLIALKTAVLKKHESRKKRKELDNEQPYSPSDDIVLSPVREIAPSYDDGVYSDGQDSVEMIEDDPDEVQIVEPQYEQIDLLDSDDNGNDMEISPPGSPPDSPIGNIDIEEHSQQPVDMDLASSDSISSAPSPVYSGNGTDQRLLLVGTDSCDSTLFHRRGEKIQESPSATPDSMEEAEAEALRHLLLTKMRQKQIKKIEVVDPTEDKSPQDEQMLCQENEMMDTAPKENVPVECLEEEKQQSASEEEPDQDAVSMSPKLTKTPNLITIVDRKPHRKRRKKTISASASDAGDVETVNTTVPSTASDLPSEPNAQLAKPSSIVHTQKLVNNPNKLININRTAALSPPTVVAGSRTESPKEPTMVETFVSRPVAKLIIQLGNSDSDSEVDFSTSSPEKGDRADDGDSGLNHAACTTGAAEAAETTGRFEEQLDKFLKSVRSKSTTNLTTMEDNAKESLEHSERGVTSSEKSLPTKQQQLRNASKKLPTTSNTMATPTAVRHLSKSSQMEYMRLVARMAQLERDKLARQNSGHTSSGVLKDSTAPKQDSRIAKNAAVSMQKSAESKLGKSPGKRKQSFSSASQPAASANEEQADPIERKLHQIRTSLPNLSEASRNRLLLTAEKQLEKHSGTFLSELERHTATLLEAQQARREQYHLENRIDLLKEKLSLLENVYEKRRQRAFETFSCLQATRKKVIVSRKRSGELERMCDQIGRIIKGDSYQLPSSSKGAEVQQQLRILVTETHQLNAIRKPTLQEFKEEMIANHRRRLEKSADQPWQATTYDNECDEGRTSEMENRQEDDIPAEPVELNPSESISQEEEACDTVPQTVSPERIDEPCTADRPAEEVVEVEKQSMEQTNNDEECLETTEPVVEQNTSPTETTTEATIEAVVEEKELPNIEVLPQEKKETITCNEPDLKQGEEDTRIANEGIVPGETFRIEKYTSPLMSLKQGAQNIPTGILCPFELGGQCVDRDCKYEHFNERTA